ncbi:protein MAINTENANCE OF MERISTEMS-like [Gastrolobium bilobum]|uniref:protein MAINTENANCE OF MERISTEMS-like n=1 Tax=Gastrolobium bilobum TaxID=150636 RepID=UPI002AB07678|nr:protein MAINTENANCE OF MERISTEMS-like [Gastrolobium bilobum]
MDASPHTIIEAREELMVSPSSGANPTHRTAYFLKPCVSSIKESACDFLLHHSTDTLNPSKLPIKVRYNGWRNPQEEWKTWVQQLQPKYEYLWIKAGVDKAIKASTYEIHRNDELILELAQRWCSKTNTFIFPWGEATITLEDIKVCWGYSVVGAPVSSPLETNEQKETEAELVAARRIFNSTKARKVVHKPWMMHFMENETKLEHEAFLVLWLSRFVFPANSPDTILKSVFPIAIHLARGIEMAIAPAVLASIYRDLSLLNSKINSAKFRSNLALSLWAPFQLVQIWALERFPSLQPHPHPIEQGQPRMARWDRVKMMTNKNLKLTLDSAGARNGFMWRPYKNSPPLKVYNENDMWECDNPSLDRELLSFCRCLRVSELEGMGCIEQYLPHRVAMQFGMDQDIPAMVARCKKDPWINFKGSYGPPPGFTSKFKRDQEVDVVRGANGQIEDVLGGVTRVKIEDDGNEAKIKSPFSDRNGANNMEGQGISPCIVETASNLENRILELERVVAKLKAAKFWG